MGGVDRGGASVHLQTLGRFPAGVADAAVRAYPRGTRRPGGDSREDRVQLEIARSLVAARDYHVLWVHDYAGTRASGAVDAIGFAETANVYFPALTRAVARFDSTGKLTTYLLILDQNFYEPNNGRLWMTI